MKIRKKLERIYTVNFSKDFKKFKAEYTESESEIFWQDGERILTEKEIEYLKIIDPYHDRVI